MKDLYGNHFNVIFRPAYLEPEGLHYRKKIFISIVIFILSSVVLFYCKQYVS